MMNVVSHLKKVLISFVVLALLGFSLPVLGEQERTTNKETLSGGKASATISIDVTDAYIEDVLKLLSQQTGLSFVPSEEILGKKLTLYLDQVPADSAVKSILDANYLTIRTPSEKTPNLYVVTLSGTPKIATITKIYKLKYARVKQTAGEMSSTFGVGGSLISQTLSSTSGAGGGSGGGAGGAPAAPGGGGGAGGGSGITGQATAGILPIIRFLLTEHGSVVPDVGSNSVIITDIPERFPLIDDIIAKIDVKPIQIYLEAEIIEVSLETLRRLGLEYGSTTGVLGQYTLPVRTSFFPYATGLLEGALKSRSLGRISFADGNIVFKMIATESDVKFLARPRLVTINNEVTEIRIVSDPVISVTSSSQQSTGTISDTAERTTVGTILRVTPVVNDNAYITMVLEPEVSKVVQSAKFSSFLDPSRRIARTTIMVPNGGTAMVAGLISSENTLAGRRLPIFGDIPLLGLPFKRTETQRTASEIIVFITPHILDENDPQPLRPTIVQEREQLPLSPREKTFTDTANQKIIRERAITETIENVLR